MVTIQFRRGTTAQNAAYTGPAGSITIDTELNVLHVHDGVTEGGHVVSDAAAIQDLQNQIDELDIESIAGLSSALSDKVDSSQVGVANGVASLDASGHVPASQLPSYVDDVVEVADFDDLPVEGETGKIYVTIDNNKIYRWSGSVYIEIVASPGSTDEVAEGSSNLYFTTARARAAVSASGDLAYDDETGVFSYTTPEVTKADVGLGDVENYGVATSGEAAAMEVNNKYMTPARVKESLEAIGFTEDNGDWTLDQGVLGG